MKDLYLRFREWLKYVRNYKNSKEQEDTRDCKIRKLENKIKKLEVQLEEKNTIEEERTNLYQKRENVITLLNEKVSNLMKRNKELRKLFQESQDEVKELEAKLAEKEHSRRVSAGAIGGLTARINELKKKLINANHIINFYKTHQKSPNIEELKAYEYSRKEVERRQKNGETKKS